MNEDFIRVVDADGTVGYLNTRYIRAFAESSDGTIGLIEEGIGPTHYIQGPLSDFVAALNYHDNKETGK